MNINTKQAQLPPPNIVNLLHRCSQLEPDPHFTVLLLEGSLTQTQCFHMLLSQVGQAPPLVKQTVVKKTCLRCADDRVFTCCKWLNDG